MVGDERETKNQMDRALPAEANKMKNHEKLEDEEGRILGYKPKEGEDDG